MRSILPTAALTLYSKLSHRFAPHHPATRTRRRERAGREFYIEILQAALTVAIGDNAKKRAVLERALAIYNGAYGPDHRYTKGVKKQLAKLASS